MRFLDYVSVERRCVDLAPSEVVALLEAYDEIGDTCIEILGINPTLDDGEPCGTYSVEFAASRWVYGEQTKAGALELAEKDMARFLKELDKRIS